jgi:hypothetical protein
MDKTNSELLEELFWEEVKQLDAPSTARAAELQEYFAERCIDLDGFLRVEHIFDFLVNHAKCEWVLAKFMLFKGAEYKVWRNKGKNWLQRLFRVTQTPGFDMDDQLRYLRRFINSCRLIKADDDSWIQAYPKTIDKTMPMFDQLNYEVSRDCLRCLDFIDPDYIFITSQKSGEALLMIRAVNLAFEIGRRVYEKQKAQLKVEAEAQMKLGKPPRKSRKVHGIRLNYPQSRKGKRPSVGK